MIVAHLWRAFILKDYVKGDTTTALGFTTYASLVLWYVALDRTKGKTDIIGILGFIALALVVLLYVAFFAFGFIVAMRSAL